MTNASTDIGRAGERAWIALFLVVFLAQGIHGLVTKSGTCDELAAHIPSGILYWKSGEFSGGLANPPLGQLLVAAGPVVSGTADEPLVDDPRHLLPARLPVLVLGMFTVLVAGTLGRLLAGAGVATIGLAALSPNLIAHARLATLDLPVTAFFALAALAAWRWSRAPSRLGLVAFGLLVGTACLVKLTALHLLPAVAVGACLDGSTWPERLRKAGLLVAAGASGIVLVAWLAYGPGAARSGLPVPFVTAILEKLEHGRQGHFAYLLGERSSRGFLLYYPVALGVKTPLPILMTAGVGLVALARGRLGGDGRGFVAWALVPAIWLFGAMALTRVNIGLRHVLPIWPALLALAGSGITYLWRGSRPARAVAVVAAAWVIFAAGTITPDHLAYFNELAGGPDRGDRFLIDSNLDWGQDEGRLRAWVDEQREAGETVTVNPAEPIGGIVAANVNAIHGILREDDRRLRWLAPMSPAHVIGHTWRIFRVAEEPLRQAAARDPVAALDWGRWLISHRRAAEAAEVLARNDLSHDARYAAEWSGVMTEAQLEAENLTEAVRRVVASRDADLAAEVAHRVSERRATPWPERDPQERSLVFAALCRRGKADEALSFARRVMRDHRATVPGFVDFEASAAGLAPTARLARAGQLRRLGLEAHALTELGELLALDAANEAALGLYGELVVRRKLGLTEFPLPPVDWSSVSRRD
jgi:hypothetical protein